MTDDKYKETKDRPCICCGKMVTVTKFISDKVVKCPECKAAKKPATQQPKTQGEAKKGIYKPSTNTGNTKICQCIKCGKDVEVTKFASAAKVLCDECKDAGEKPTQKYIEGMTKFNIDMNKLDRNVVPTIENYTVVPQLIANKKLREVICPACGKSHMKIVKVLDWNPMGLIVHYQCQECLLLLTLSEQANKLVTMNNNGAFYDYSGDAIEDMTSTLRHTRLNTTVRQLIKIIKDNNIKVDGIDLPYVYEEDRPVPVGFEIPKGDRNIKVVDDMIKLLSTAPREGNPVDEPGGNKYIKISDTLTVELIAKLKQLFKEEENGKDTIA